MEEINNTSSAPSHIARRDSDDDTNAGPGINAAGDNADTNEINDTTNKNDTNDNKKEDSESFTLFVSGVAPAVTEEDLSLLFSPYGHLLRVQIMRDPHRPEPHRGFAFIAFATQAEAERAIAEQHGAMWRERRLAVEAAKRSRPHAPTPGRYNGRRGREVEGVGAGRGGDRRHYRGRSPRRSPRRRHYRRSRSRSADSRHHYRSSRPRSRSRSRSPPRRYEGEQQPYYRPPGQQQQQYPPYGYAPYPYPSGAAAAPAANDPYVPERPAFYPPPPHQPTQQRRY